MTSNQSQGVRARSDDVLKEEFEDLVDKVGQIHEGIYDQNVASVRTYQQIYTIAGRAEEQTDILNTTMGEIADIALQIRPRTPAENEPPQRAILQRMFEIMRTNDPHMAGIHNETRAVARAMQMLIDLQRDLITAITQTKEEQTDILNTTMGEIADIALQVRPVPNAPANTAILPRIFDKMRKNETHLEAIHDEAGILAQAAERSIELQEQLITAVTQINPATRLNPVMSIADKFILFVIVFALGIFVAHYMIDPQPGPIRSIPFNNISIEDAAERASATLGNILGQNPQWNTVLKDLIQAQLVYEMGSPASYRSSRTLVVKTLLD